MAYNTSYRECVRTAWGNEWTRMNKMYLFYTERVGTSNMVFNANGY